MMGPQPVHSRGRLGPFLLNLLDRDKIQGLEWLNRDEKLFKMLWIDKRKTGRSGGHDINAIFKEWEIYNHRHKEGEEEDPNKWKQTFRGALNKSPDVQEDLEKSKELSPYKVFRFSDAIKVETLTSLNFINKRQLDTINKGENCYHQGNLCIQSETGPEQSNIPKVVIDELFGMKANYFPTSTATPRCVLETNIPQLDDVGHGVITTDSDSDFKLDSDDWEDIFQRCSSMDLSPLHSFSTPDNSLGRDKPLVKFQVFYSDNPVLKDEMINSGIRLFFGPQHEEFWPHNLIGPHDFRQVELPDVRKFENTINVHEHKIVQTESILEKMCRGLLLNCNDHSLFALRLCTTRIYAWNNLTGLIALDRKNKIQHQLFDMNIFIAQMNLHKSDPLTHFCPSPTVTLIFGQDYDPRNNFQKLLARVELTFVEAERLYQKEILNDLQFSGLDSGDVLAQNLNSMNVM